MHILLICMPKAIEKMSYNLENISILKVKKCKYFNNIFFGVICSKIIAITTPLFRLQNMDESNENFQVNFSIICNVFKRK